MKPAIALMPVLVCAAVAALWLTREGTPEVDRVKPSQNHETKTESDGLRVVASGMSEVAKSGEKGGEKSVAAPRIVDRVALSTTTSEQAAGSSTLGVSNDVARAWPVRSTSGTTPATAGRGGANPDVSVPTKIAFRALWYLGTDPEAEKTWLRAINDRNQPPGVRSDLIIDMVDEGYSDNDHPSEVDLPIIKSRLELIERYAPFAIDDVNKRAFEVAYRELLELYLRLGDKR
ncbi:MAG: hypothetical protein KDC95_12375 [Planctomycetes bacterium]|nr:hypothetical protein [Planctomycetota bacterium]